jgi:hypothetical protein
MSRRGDSATPSQLRVWTLSLWPALTYPAARRESLVLVGQVFSQLSASIWTIHGTVLGPEWALTRRKSDETRKRQREHYKQRVCHPVLAERGVCAMKSARGLIPGRHDYTPPARTVEDDRCLVNWLSTRITPDGLDCHPDSTYERALVEHRIAYAQALGLQVQPSVYLAQGSMRLQKMSHELAFADFLVLRSRKRAS